MNICIKLHEKRGGSLKKPAIKGMETYKESRSVADLGRAIMEILNR